MENLKLSFDGFGLNEASAEYSPRIATLTTSMLVKNGQEIGKEIEKRVNNYQTMIELLKRAANRLDTYHVEMKKNQGDNISKEIDILLKTL